MTSGQSALEGWVARAAEAMADGGADPFGRPDELVDLVSRIVLADPTAEASDVDEVLARVAPFGGLHRLFADPLVEEIWFNRPDRVMVARSGVPAVSGVSLLESEVPLIVERMLRASGRRLDRSVPFVDAPLPDGSRLHVAIPPITQQHWAVNIRRYVVAPLSVAGLVSADVLPQAAADYLAEAVRQRRSIVVAGATQAGKTTMLNALLGSVAPDERIVSCEEVLEVRVDHIDWVAMQTRPPGLEGSGEVPLGQLVKESLRMRPTRLVIGEVRRAEALDLLIAANSGIATLSTVHANSCADAALKMATLPLLAGPNITTGFVAPTVASCLDVFVHLRMAPDGSRRVTEIAETTGRVTAGRPELHTVWRQEDEWAEGQRWPGGSPDPAAAA